MKNLLRVGLLSVVLASSFALAQDSTSTTDTTTEGGGSGMRRSGYLLDRSSHDRPMLLAVHGILPYGAFWYGGFGFGVGGTFYIPLVKDGFIPPLNDEFGIDFGADLMLWPGAFSYAPISIYIPVSALWTFHFTDTFAAYVKVGVALRIWPGYLAGTFGGGVIWPDFVSSVGLNWMFAKNMGLRAELGYPGIKVGLLFAF